MHILVLVFAWVSAALVQCREQRQYGLYYSKYHHGIVYGSGMVPENQEVDVVLNNVHPQKFYFVLESGYTPISVTVTPCSRDIVLEWKLSHSIFQNSIDERPAGWSNHVLHPPTPSPTAAYLGRERRTYNNPWAPSGLYTLELRGQDPLRAQVLVATRQTHSESYHPSLPPDSTVRIVKVKRNRILVSWKASLSSRPVHYCVAVNHRGNFNSFCSAQSELGTTIDCNVGSRTWYLFKGLSRGKTHFLDVFAVDDVTNASTTYVGVSATLHHPQKHHQNHHHHQQTRLKEEAVNTFTLDESNGYEVSVKYLLGSGPGPLLLFVQSCTGPGPVNVHITHHDHPTNYKQDVMSTTVLDVKTLTIPLPTNHSDSYLTLTLRATTRGHPRSVRLWMSGGKRQTPFPRLPEDKGVRVFDTLTTCDSVTIGWKTSPDERVKYCIYRRSVDDAQTHRRLAAQPQDFCPADAGPSPTSSGRKTVLCRRYHKFSKHRFSNLVMQKVKGLKRGTRYLFEVQVTKTKGGMLPYEQVWATTSELCSKNG